VGETLFNEGIMKFLIGNGKSVLLVTHQIHFLKQCEHIVLMHEGRVAAQGSFDDLTRSGFNLDFKGKEQEGAPGASGEGDDGDETAAITVAARNRLRTRSRALSALDDELTDDALLLNPIEASPRERASSTISPRERVSASAPSAEEAFGVSPAADEEGNDVESPRRSSFTQQDDVEVDGHITTEEERHVGRIKLDVYYWFFNDDFCRAKINRYTDRKRHRITYYHQDFNRHFELYD